MKTKTKNIFKSALSLTLALIMVLGVAPLSELAGADWAGLFAPKAEAATSGIYTYEIANGKATITDCDTSASGAITIPSTLGGYPVTTIGDRAFEYCDSLTSVTIPNSVTSIGDEAFRYCYSLTSVTIGNSVTSIGDSAFFSCDSLTSVTIPNSVTSIGAYAFEYCNSLTSVTIPNSVTSIGYQAFYSCNSLTSVTIGNSVTSIGGYAFCDCGSLTSVTIGNSVASIGKGAFYGCDLTSVTIPNSVTSIGDGAFKGCDRLTNITVDSSNKYYSSADGVLFNKDKTELIQYPIGNARTSYTIPNSVTSIGNNAFRGCNNLTSVTIPDSVTSIGAYAFFSCDSLTDVYYTGTEEEWKSISIGNYNDPLLNATIHYNSSSTDDRISTYCGTLEDTITTVVLNGTETWVSGAVVDGKTYSLSKNSKYQSTIDNYKGKKVVCSVQNGEIVWIKPISEIATSISCSITPETVTYNGKKYNTETTEVWVKISNTLNESDFVGDPTVLANIPELEVIIPNAELRVDNTDIFNFGGKQIYSTPVKTLGLGQSTSFSVTANVKNKKPDNAVEVKVGVSCTFNITRGDQNFTRTAYGDFKIINNDFKEPTVENVNGSSDKEYNDRIAKAVLELEKATTAAFTLEADVSNSLRQIFTSQQLELMSRIILCEAAMQAAPEETFEEELERRVIEKVFSINTRWLRILNDKIVVTIAMQSKDYGIVQVKFTYNRTQPILNNEPFAFYGDVDYEIIKSEKPLPDSINRSGMTGYISMADMSAFCNAAYGVAQSELKRSYNKAWGNDANKAADIIFGKSVNAILSKTKYKSVSGVVWAIMSAPAKEIEIRCPVDVYVYDENDKLVAAVEDNKVTLSNENVDISVDGDIKTIRVYDDTYRLEYRSSAESTMDIIVSEFGGSGQLLETNTFENVPLKIGVNYTQNIDDTYMNESDYELVSGDTQILPTKTKFELHAHTSSSARKTGRKATCAEYGWDYNFCDECNEWYEVITTAEHTYGDWQTVTPPTVESDGLEKRICSTCGAEETQDISKLEPVAATSIELNKSKKSLTVGDTFTLTATVKPSDATDKSVVWSSSDTSVATVDENGVVTAVSEGSATITASSSNGAKADCTVTVKQNGNSIFKKILNVLLTIITAPFRLIISLFKLIIGLFK